MPEPITDNASGATGAPVVLPPEPAFLSRNVDLLAGKAGDDTTLPSEFCIFTAKFVETTKGVFVFDESAAATVLAAAEKWGNAFSLDYDHAMLGFGWMPPTNPAESGKAAGWFGLDLRDGELWAVDVSWTPAAAQMLKDREYRYTSPAFRCDDDGQISELINVALTNLPATHKLTPLVASRFAGQPTPAAPETEAPKEKSMEKLLKALGLDKDATDDQAVEAFNKAVEAAAKPADPTPEPPAPELPAEAAAKVALAQKEAEDAKAELAKMKEAAQLASYVEKASALKALPGHKPEELGRTLMDLNAKAPEEARVIEELLGKAAKAVEATLLGETGHGGDPSPEDPVEQAKALAKKKQEADPTLTPQQALSKVLDESPDLYARYRAELDSK